MKGKRNRKPTRLPDYDYSSDGYYFVTVCTRGHDHCLGSVVDGHVVLNWLGKIVEQCWLDLPNHYVNCQLDEYIIMPNHMHGIIVIENSVVNGGSNTVGTLKRNTVGTLKRNTVVGNGFKPFPTKEQEIDPTKEQEIDPTKEQEIDPTKEQANKPTKNRRHGLSEFIRAFKTFSSRRINERYSYKRFQWQKSFYDHIIRNEADLSRVREYVMYNALEWEEAI